MNATVRTTTASSCQPNVIAGHDHDVEVVPFMHILSRLGHLQLAAIRRHHVKTLILELKKKLAPRSAADVITVLSMVLQEAVEDRRIPFNACRGVRVNTGGRPERPHATTAQVAAIAA